MNPPTTRDQADMNPHIGLVLVLHNPRLFMENLKGAHEEAHEGGQGHTGENQGSANATFSE